MQEAAQPQQQHPQPSLPPPAPLPLPTTTSPIRVELLRQSLEMGDGSPMEEVQPPLQAEDGDAELAEADHEPEGGASSPKEEDIWDDRKWASKEWVRQLVEEELDIQVVLMQEKFEKALEEALHPLQMWADWLHTSHEEAQEKIVRLTSYVGALEARLAALEGGAPRQGGPQDSGKEVIRVQTASGVLEMSPQKTSYFGSGAITAGGGYFATGASQLGGSVGNVQAVQVCALHGDERRNFNPLLGAGLVAGNPALLALHKELKTPHFSGEQSKWHQFVRDWGKWSAYVLLGAPVEVEKIWRRDLFVNCLHSSLKEQYENLIAMKATMTFEEIFADLEKQFALDNPNIFREEWKKVTLKADVNMKLTDFLLWKSRYLSARAQVQDWTEEEDRNLVLKNLPAHMHKSILEKEAKDGERRFVGKLVGTGAPEDDVKTAFEQLLGPIKGVRKLKGVHMVEFNTEQQL